MRHWRTALFVCLIFLWCSPASLAQIVYGSTNLDIDPGAGTVTATCETDVDNLAAEYYEAMVSCVVEDSNNNIVASGGGTDDSGQGYVQVVLTFTGVPGETYTAMSAHSLFEIYTAEFFPDPDDPQPIRLHYYDDVYDFSSYADNPQTYDDFFELDSPGPETETVSSIQHAANSVATKSWTCFAQLKYRAVKKLGITVANHSFWWIQDSVGQQYIIDGGPQNAGCTPNCGYLVDWVTPGTVGHYPDDQIGAGTWFDSGTSPAVCSQVGNLEAAAKNWNQALTLYNPTGPNSNTFAHSIATSGGFAPTQPPSAVGW
ncbi:MAG TPA: hypothetical protein VHW70_08785 [Edaphobacter sp.]|jgi:hypothetical protein|nr:hypothetical protein [Edaphobacter sp.]